MEDSPGLLCMIKYLSAVFLLLSTLFYAQYEAVVGKPYREKYMVLDSLLEASKDLPTLADAKKKSLEIIQLGKRKKDISLQLEGEYYLAFYILSAEKYEENAAVDALEKIASKAEKKGVTPMQIRVNHILGYYFFKVKKNYERGFRYYLKTRELLDEVSSYEFPNKAKYSHNIANAFYDFRDFSTAINILRDVEPDAVDRYNWYTFWSAQNNLGVYYERINKIDSAMYFYERALDNPHLKKDDIRYTITKGNIGNILAKQGNHTEAIPLLLEDMENAIRNDDCGVAANAAVGLANIYIMQSDFPKAKYYLDNARIYIEVSQQNERLFEFYRAYSDYHAKLKNYEEMAKYKDSLLAAHQNNELEFDAMVLLRAQQKENYNKLKNEEEEKANIERRGNIILVTIVLFFAGGIVGSTVWLQRRHKKRERKKEEEVLRVNEKLAHAEKELELFSQRIEENQRISESYNRTKSAEVDDEALEQLRRKTILTEDDWREFSRNFNTFYPGFTLKVKDRIPAVTPAELRLLMLTKLKMDSKQIAAAQGISSSAVRTTWYRLRKKMHVDEELSAAQLVKRIEEA